MDRALHTQPPLRQRVLAYAGLAVWVVICLVLGGTLMIDHLITLPTPAPTDPALHDAIARLRRPEQRGRWLVLHVLAEDCGCSRRVLDHLLAAPRPAQLAERIVLVTERPPGEAETVAQIRARGFDLDTVTPDELGARYHVEAAPLLVVVDPLGAVRYLGGYTPRKQAADIRDLAVIEATRRGEAVEPLPTFGCAVGRALREQRDPFAIRNGR